MIIGTKFEFDNPWLANFAREAERELRTTWARNNPELRGRGLPRVETALREIRIAAGVQQACLDTYGQPCFSEERLSSMCNDAERLILASVILDEQLWETRRASANVELLELDPTLKFRFAPWVFGDAEMFSYIWNLVFQKGAIVVRREAARLGVDCSDLMGADCGYRATRLRLLTIVARIFEAKFGRSPFTQSAKTIHAEYVWVRQILRRKQQLREELEKLEEELGA